MLTLEEQRQTAPPAGTGPQKEQAVQRMFSSIARYYDLNNSLLSLGLHHSWKSQAAAHPLGDSRVVLDAGAGAADLALLAARRLREHAWVVAVDLDGHMLASGLLEVPTARLQ